MERRKKKFVEWLHDQGKQKQAPWNSCTGSSKEKNYKEKRKEPEIDIENKIGE